MLTELTVPLRKMSSDERDVPKKTAVAIVYNGSEAYPPLHEEIVICLLLSTLTVHQL